MNTGDSTHVVWTLVDVSGSLGNELWVDEPCDCDAHDDHDLGQEIRHRDGDDL